VTHRDEQPWRDDRTAPSSALLAALRIAALALFSTAILALYLLVRLVVRNRAARLRIAPKWIRAWCRGSSMIIGLKCHVHGAIPTGPALLAPNHMGYADFLVFGGATPCFILSRADLRSWPGIGALVAASENPTVTRRRGRDIRESAAQMTERLAIGKPILVFLEGTSTGGDRVLPFMPSFLQPVIDSGAPIVPIGLQWQARDPRVNIAEDVAYWKDHKFGPHTWRLLGMRGITAHIRIGEPIHPNGKSRRQLAEETRNAVCELSGLPPGKRTWTEGDDI